ncbi:hypothetical protein ACOBQJ_08040 [Pelotomaculum propionicicum]|uniref:hypothetical protein n=1 Tax=Pelotomaculum propionicicum TaxID=258475 RepID=UPI003B78ED84
MGKTILFVRERRKVEKGEKKPRFAFVGSVGTDLRIKVKHIRKNEIEQIAAMIGAEVVYLEAGKHEDDEDEDED